MCIIFYGEKIMNNEKYMELALKEAEKAFKKEKYLLEQ